MAAPAAGFVHLRGAHDHNRIIIMSRLAIDQALRAAGWLPANHTNGIELIYSALAMSTGMQPKGSPRKSVSSPVTITRMP